MALLHVSPRTREVGGAILAVRTSNGYVVLRGNDYLGFLHASLGDQWNAYLRVPPECPAISAGSPRPRRWRRSWGGRSRA